MKSRKIKTEISEKLKNVCEELSEKERKGVLVGMLAISTVLCAITVTRAFGRFLSHGTQKELPFVRPGCTIVRMPATFSPMTQSGLISCMALSI